MSPALFLWATPVKDAAFNVQLDNMTGGWNRTNDLRSAEANPLRAYRLRHTGLGEAQVPWCTDAKWRMKYRQQVSILWPSAYKAITISKSDRVVK